MVTALRSVPAQRGTKRGRRREAWRNWGWPALVALLLAAGIAFRLYARSALWLDEAQSVAIARLPVDQLFAALRQDGSPPLYYLMLHGWIALFGSGTLAVRSLSTVVSLATLPLAFWAGWRLTGRRSVAWAALLLFVSSPFAIRYATETRMYALLILLTLLGVHALLTLWRRPGPLPVLGLALVSGLLALTHYWSLYLLAVLGAALAWYAVRAGPQRAPARRALLALGIGALLFLPWLPSFLYQAAHTGTPWAGSPDWTAAFNIVAGWGQGSTPLWLGYWALAVLGVFAQPMLGRRLVLELPANPLGRLLAGGTAGTLLVALVAAMAAGSGYSLRYSSVALAPFLLLLALGTAVLGQRARRGVLAVVAALGLAAGAPATWQDRSSASDVAAVLRADAAPGDLVVYCPDQLGPAIARLVPSPRRQVVYPTFAGAQRVNWVDYAQRNETSDPAVFARRAARLAGADETIWLVYADNYRTLGDDCPDLRQLLTVARPHATVAFAAHGHGAQRVRVLRYPPG